MPTCATALDRSVQVSAYADLTFASFFRSWDGYGFMAEYLALGMQRAGASVGARPARRRPRRPHRGDARRCSPAALPADGPVLWFAQPEGVAGAFPHAHDVFINTMWESRPASARLGGTAERGARGDCADALRRRGLPALGRRGRRSR